MKRLCILAGMAAVVCAVPVRAGRVRSHQCGGIRDYFRTNATGTNMFGVGGRVGVTVLPHVKLEAEMAYDFQQEFARDLQTPAEEP